MPDQPEPHCRTCGTPYVDHLGLEGTCKRLKEVTAAARKVFKYISLTGYTINDRLLFVACLTRMKVILDRIEAEDEEARNG